MVRYYNPSMFVSGTITKVSMVRYYNPGKYAQVL